MHAKLLVRIHSYGDTIAEGGPGGKGSAES
jgi:hypothetical protein